MPVPIIGYLIGAFVVGGAAKIYNSVRKTKQAKKEIDIAKKLVNNSKKLLEEKRDSVTGSLKELGKVKIDIWGNVINEFVNEFEKIKNVILVGEPLTENIVLDSFSPENINSVKQVSLNAKEIVLGGSGAIGAGALTGWAVYGGVMQLGAASTGTLISTLSGAAASNATLAWLGGGSLAVGGGGMAAGTMVLGGIITAPILLVMGALMEKKADKNLSQAKVEKMKALKYSKEVKNAVITLDKIEHISNEYIYIIKEMQILLESRMTLLQSLVSGKNILPIQKNRKLLYRVLNKPNEMIRKIGFSFKKLFREKFIGTDFSTYSENQKKFIFETVQIAQVLKNLLEVPILDENTGAFKDECKEALTPAKVLIDNK